MKNSELQTATAKFLFLLACCFVILHALDYFVEPGEAIFVQCYVSVLFLVYFIPTE